VRIALWMRKRKLLGDHPAHRDAENVCRIDFEGIRRAQSIRGELDDREWLIHAAAPPHAAMVIDDRLKSSRKESRNGSPQESAVPLIPMIISSGGTGAGAFVS